MKSKLKLALAGAAFLGVAVGAPSTTGSKVPGRILVLPRPGVTADQIYRTLNGHGARLKKNLASLGVSVIEVPESQTAKTMALLEKTGLFTYVEQDQWVNVAAVPNDPDFAYQWHLAKIQAPSAWDLTSGSASIPIAIIDTGVDSTHTDLAGKVLPGWNFRSGTADTSDGYGHGTSTAGAAAASANNLAGIAGVAWANPIMPLVAVDASGGGTLSDVADAISWATRKGARIISISITGNGPSSTLQRAVDSAWKGGALIFAAVGNDARMLTSLLPAGCDKVVGISATGVNDEFASYSNYGTSVDLSAPGSGILTTVRGGGYSYKSGTSFSAPIAAGTAALALSANPSLTNTTLLSLLKSTSDDLGAPGYDWYFGFGRINAFKLVQAAKNAINNSDSKPPAVSLTAPANGARMYGTIYFQGTATDNVGVTQVDVEVDGQLVGSSTSPSFSIAWNSAGGVNGGHWLSAVAYDAAGNTTTTTRLFYVNNDVFTDTTAPSIRIVTPENMQVVSGYTTVNVTASDNIAVSQISLFVDGGLVSTVSSSAMSYRLNTNKLSPGNHTLTATAWDLAGNMGYAAPVMIQRQ